MTKQQINKRSAAATTVVYKTTTAHKVWGVIALAGLFTCGLVLGWTLRPNVTCEMPNPDNGGFIEVVQVSTDSENVATDNKPTCVVIQELLANRIYPENEPDYVRHLLNASTYSTMAERGCPENAEKYKEMALREIEIATALQGEEDMEMYDTEIVIDTYKKLNMQREAQEFLNKVQKLTDPAIDFILKMEKIINE